MDRPAGMQASERLLKLRSRRPKVGEASFFFFDTTFGVESCKVLPGEYFVYHEDIVIQTLLGSCVAACIHDRGAGVGGMNHFLLPEGDDASARYGVNAMEMLINELLAHGARRSALEAKIFGGAAVIQGMSQLSIGKQNVAFVERFLAQERIPILSRDVLDVHPRKVCMFPKSGKAMVKKLAPAASGALASEESRYRSRIKDDSANGGSVELF